MFNHSHELMYQFCFNSSKLGYYFIIIVNIIIIVIIIIYFYYCNNYYYINLLLLLLLLLLLYEFIILRISSIRWDRHFKTVPNGIGNRSSLFTSECN